MSSKFLYLGSHCFFWMIFLLFSKQKIKFPFKILRQLLYFQMCSSTLQSWKRFFAELTNKLLIWRNFGWVSFYWSCSSKLCSALWTFEQVLFLTSCVMTFQNYRCQEGSETLNWAWKINFISILHDKIENHTCYKRNIWKTFLQNALKGVFLNAPSFWRTWSIYCTGKSCGHSQWDKKGFLEE